MGGGDVAADDPDVGLPDRLFVRSPEPIRLFCLHETAGLAAVIPDLHGIEDSCRSKRQGVLAADATAFRACQSAPFQAHDGSASPSCRTSHSTPHRLESWWCFQQSAVGFVQLSPCDSSVVGPKVLRGPLPCERSYPLPASTGQVTSE